jgi:hypothetical protein
MSMPWRDRLLWVALGAGPLAVTLDLVLSWMLAPGSHEKDDITPLWVLTACALVIAAGGGVLAWSQLPKTPPDPEERPRFMALAGIALALFCVLVVLGLAVPKWLLTPGMEP